MVLTSKHQTLDENGRGLCSVPMWMMGCPAGFCDEEAYSERPEPPYYYKDGRTGQRRRGDCRYDGYVPALACPAHGGEKTRVFKDGNMFCAVEKNFINLQESKAAFGETVEAARRNYELQ